MTRARATRRALSVALLVAVGALVALAAASYLGGRQGDFRHFYEAGAAVRSGADLYASHKGGYVYPPLLAVVLAPLSMLPMTWAGATWAVANGVMLVLAARVCAREMVDAMGVADRNGLVEGAALVGFLVLIDKARAAMMMGQTDPAVLLACVMALRWAGRRPILCGLALALAIMVKYQALIFVPYLLVRRRLVEGGAAAAWTVGLALSTAVVFGWSRNLAYLGEALGVLREVIAGDESASAASPHGLAWDRSVSIPSAIARWMGDAPTWQVLAVSLGVAACVAGIVAAMYRVRGVRLFGREPSPASAAWRARLAVEWAGLVVAVVAFSPQTEARHMLLTLPMTTLAAVMLLSREGRGSRWLVGAGLVVLVAGLYLPPGGPRFDAQVDAWRAVGGASWCMVAALLAVVWCALPRCRARGSATAE